MLLTNFKCMFNESINPYVYFPLSNMKIVFCNGQYNIQWGAKKVKREALKVDFCKCTAMHRKNF